MSGASLSPDHEDMSTLAPADGPRVTRPATRSATRSQVDWLAEQLSLWQAEGLVDRAQAERISGRYRADHRFPLARLLLTLGAAFVGVGADLAGRRQPDRALARGSVSAPSPLLAGLPRRRARRSPYAARTTRARSSHPLPAGRRGPADGRPGLGAVVFQAAQSLQVPAYEPVLVGQLGTRRPHPRVRRAGGDAAAGRDPGRTAWFVWQVLDAADSELAGVACVMTAGVVAVAASALHTRRLDGLAAPWREVGAAPPARPAVRRRAALRRRRATSRGPSARRRLIPGCGARQRPA